MEEIQRSSWYDKYPTIILLQEFQKTSSPGGCLFGISKNHPTGLGLHRGRPHPWYPCWDLSLSTRSSPPRSIHLGKALVKHPTEDCHPKKHPSFSLSRGRLFRFFGEGQGDMKKRVTYFLKIPVTLFFCSHTYPVLCWMEVVQMAVLGDIRKLIFHWSMILGPFTGHPNLLELNQKKQPASKFFKLHGSHS